MPGSPECSVEMAQRRQLRLLTLEYRSPRAQRCCSPELQRLAPDPRRKMRIGAQGATLDTLFAEYELLLLRFRLSPTLRRTFVAVEPALRNELGPLEHGHHDFAEPGSPPFTSDGTATTMTDAGQHAHGRSSLCVDVTRGHHAVLPGIQSAEAMAIQVAKNASRRCIEACIGRPTTTPRRLS